MVKPSWRRKLAQWAVEAKGVSITCSSHNQIFLYALSKKFCSTISLNSLNRERHFFYHPLKKKQGVTSVTTRIHR